MPQDKHEEFVMDLDEKGRPRLTHRAEPVDTFITKLAEMPRTLNSVRTRNDQAVSANSNFGFIAREGCPDLFFHIHDCEPGAAAFIQRGAPVEFTVRMDQRGRLRAADVELY